MANRIYSSRDIETACMVFDSEYITWLAISERPTDTRTLIPFLKEILADAGYESEENYMFIEENQQLAFIKP